MGDGRIAGVGRHGIPGYEKVGLVTEDHSRRDLSILVTELDGTFFSGQWWCALDGLDPTTLPPVAAGIRVAPCLERPVALLLARADTGRLVNVSGITLAGARDPLPRAESARACTAGVVAITGASGGDGGVGAAGFCSFLLVEAAPEPSDQLRYPRHGTVYLGPFVVAPDAEWPHALMLAVGPDQHKMVVPSTAIEAALASLDADHAVPGAAVLVGAGQPVAMPQAESIRLDGGVLGEQAHARSTASSS